jgi:uncharacterized protein YihD (DUF1040 family)
MLLTDLFEAIKPGDIRNIKLKIADAEKALRDIEKHELKMRSISGSTVIPGTEKEFEDLKVAYQTYIDDLKSQLEKAKQVQKKDPLETYMKAILKNCKTVVSASQTTGELLYRGVSDTNAPAYYGKPFDQRNPLHSNRNFNDAFNYALKMEGVEARRDNSMFCTTSKSFAQGFGNELYIIFPRDPFHFTWSDKVKDLVLDDRTMGDMIDPNVTNMIMKEVWENEEYKNEFIKNYSYRRGIEPENVEWNPSLFNSDSGSSRNTFTKYTMYDSFLAVVPIISKMEGQYSNFDDLKYWTSGKEIIENFGLRINEDLVGAFEKRYEITIRAEYYAIHSRYQVQVMKYLGMGKDTW